MEYENVRWEQMKPNEFIQAVKEKPVAYIPLGLLEWHGDHLPLGLDALKIHGICCRIAGKTGGVVMPPVYFGRPGFGSYAGTMVFSEELIYKLLMELYAQLKKCGFKVIAAIAGHYGPVQLNLIKKTALDYMKEDSSLKIIAQTEGEGLTPEPADHAGKWETSFGMTLFPELVDMNEFHFGECPIVRYGDEEACPEYLNIERSPWVWMEDLSAVSSAQLGEEVIQRIVDDISIKVDNALGANNSL